MKNSFTKLLIMTVVSSVITLLLCYGALKIGGAYDFFEYTGEIAGQVQDGGPGAGEALVIFGGFTFMIEALGSMIFFSLLVILPVFIVTIATAMQLIAQLFQIGINKRWKCIVSKVFTIISLVLQIALCLLLIYNIFVNMAANKIILIVASILYIVYLILFIIIFAKIKTPEKIAEPAPVQ